MSHVPRSIAFYSASLVPGLRGGISQYSRFIRTSSWRPMGRWSGAREYSRTSATCSTTPTVWPGLDEWRGRGEVDRRVVWGDDGACTENEASEDIAGVYRRLWEGTDVNDVSCATVADYGNAVLCEPNPLRKAALTHKALEEFHSGLLGIHSTTPEVAPDVPARPEKPELLPARQIPTLKETPLPMNGYTLHNLAHVELNAIDLAWDTIVRFSHLQFLPQQFYLDFLGVADDEARHLGWCLQRMSEVGVQYGDMPAHNLLWEGCIASAGDVRERLAVVPMSQEARGLDAGGRLAERLVGWGDNRSAAIVARIADEEQAHVAVGVYWFNTMCHVLGQDAKRVFIETLSETCPDLLRAPFNHDARQKVGLPRDFYDESLWDAASREKIERIRQHRKQHGSLGLPQREPLSLDGDDDALLKSRLELFISQEIDMKSV